jgi:riboflavin kinase/FMN adenylyltransferase
MTIICNTDNIPENIKNPVVTIGNFDGVHCAHQTIFSEVTKRASDIKGTSVAITFEPHPLKVISPEKFKPLITTLEQKKELVAEQGLDILLVIDFTPEFRSIAAKEFVQNILVRCLGIREIVVGYDYAFGNKREGNIDLLKEMGGYYNFNVIQMEPVRIGETLVSSTSIRNLITEGNISEANRLLGRNYQIRGEVVEGKNRGKSLLGYATANLKTDNGLMPREGVYIVTVELEGKVYQGLTNIGRNPTFKNKALSVETHLLDLSTNILNQRIKVNFLARLRDEITFSEAGELSRQISKDIEQASKFFKRNNL